MADWDRAALGEVEFQAVRSFQLPVPKPQFDAENERQNRNALQQHLQDLSQVNEGALAFTDIALANASTTKHGLMPKLPNDVTTYLDGTGKWSIPGAAGAGVITPVDWSFPRYPHPTPLSRSGWTASAASGTASNAIDGNPATSWNTGNAIVVNVDAITIDMGAAISVAGFLIQNGTNASWIPAAGNVLYSDDGTSYTLIASWTQDDALATALAVSWTAATHRYWKLVATAQSPVWSRWWKIFELYLYTTPYALPAWNLSTQRWQSGPLQAVWLKGVFTKRDAGDAFGVGIGYDVDHLYGLYHNGSSTTIDLMKVVDGVRTALATITLDNDTKTHEFELELITPAGPGQDNWITTRIGRANNPQASAGLQDNALDFTSHDTGAFPLFAATDMTALGCSYVLLPSTTAPDAKCTIATGGDYVYQDGDYRVHAFYTSGTFTVVHGGVGSAEVYVVAGGGGAHGNNGGGAGGYATATYNLAPGAYSVGIGTGGAGGAGGGSNFDATTARGGGYAAPSRGGGSGSFGGGAAVGISGGCVNPPACSAVVSVGGGGASAFADGTDAALTGHSFDCLHGVCSATGTWGAGGGGAHLSIANHDSVTYQGFDVCWGGFGAGSASGGGSVSGPSPGTRGGEPVGWGGAGESTGGGGNGGNGLVLVRYLYNPTVCGV